MLLTKLPTVKGVKYAVLTDAYLNEQRQRDVFDLVVILRRLDEEFRDSR